MLLDGHTDVWERFCRCSVLHRRCDRWRLDNSFRHRYHHQGIGSLIVAGQMMATKRKKSDVFLIVSDDRERATFAAGLKRVGYIVHDYMTADAFLIDRKKYSSGVVVAEFRLKSLSGLELAKQLSKECSNFAVVMIANRQDTPKVVAGKSADVVVKPTTLKTLQEAIVRATDGEVFTATELQTTFRKLTKRELKIAELVIAGKSSLGIAEKLGIAKNTVETHRANLMGKTRAEDLGHLARLWRAWKQLE